QWTFTPNANFNGTVNISYDVSDGIANTVATNSFNLAAVNDVPVLTGVKATLIAGTEDTTYTIKASDLLTGYTDADNGETDNLTVIGLSATNGAIRDNNDGTYTFTPNKDYNGKVDLRYLIRDPGLSYITAESSFNISAANDVPITATKDLDAIFSDINEDESLTINTASLLNNYADPDGNSLSVSEFKLSANSKAGTVVKDSSGNWVFTPSQDYNGIATFEYKISDGSSTLSQKYTINVLSVNDAPSGSDSTLSATTGELVILKPSDFGFLDNKDRDGMKSVILNMTSAGIANLILTDRDLTSSEIAMQKVEVTYQQLSDGYVAVRAGAISTTRDILFQVVDDGDTTSGGINTDQSPNKLSIFATPPISNDAQILQIIRVNQALTELEGLLPPSDRDPRVIQAASGLSKESRELFLTRFESGLFDGDPERARRFVYSNLQSQADLESQKDALTSQKDDLASQRDDLALQKEALKIELANALANASAGAEIQAKIDAAQARIDAAQAKIDALQSQVVSLEGTLEEYTSLVPDVSLLDDLVQRDSDGKPLPVDLDLLKVSLGDAADSILSGASVNGQVAVQLGTGQTIEIDETKLAELLAQQQETFNDALKKGFSSAAEGTIAQIKTIAAASEFGIELPTDLPGNINQLTEEQRALVEQAEKYQNIAKEFLAAGLTVADVLTVGDPTLVARAKALIEEGDAIAVQRAKQTLENVKSPFGGAPVITSADLINEATRIKRTFADPNISITEVDTLGTAELSNTNAAYIGALDGSIAGMPGVTFSADSKTMVFVFPLREGQTKTTQVLSYLAGGADIYTYQQAVDANNNPIYGPDNNPVYALDNNGNRIVTGFSDAALEQDAGHPEGKYDTYLKYVSYDDLIKYGATPTGQIDAQSASMIFSWGNPGDWGNQSNTLKTADRKPLTLLSAPAGVDLTVPENFSKFAITKPGWYDFTRPEGSNGDGAKYITITQGVGDAAITRIVGVELNFTRDMFGDKTPGDNQITDPGATIAVVPVGNGKLEVGQIGINENELIALREQAAAAAQRQAAGGGTAGIQGNVLQAGFKAVPQDAVVLLPGQQILQPGQQVLEPGQFVLNAGQQVIDGDQRLIGPNDQVLQPGEIAVPADTPVTPESSVGLEVPEMRSPQLIDEGGVDGPGESLFSIGEGEADNELAAMNIGDGGATAAVTSSTSGSGSSESQIQQNELSTQPNGNSGGESESDSKGEIGGKGAGTEGLGEDQSPKTERKRGLMLQPIVEQKPEQDGATRSRLLKNLSEGSVLGTNLLDALALGAGVLYALYAPKAVETGKKGLRGLVNRVMNRGGTNTVITEQNLLSVFVMKMPNGEERLVAARVNIDGMDVLAQQDLPPDVRVDGPGSQTQVDYAMKQLLNKLGSANADLLLLGPKLKGQAALLQNLAKQIQLLNTQDLSSTLSSCSATELEALQNWLNKPSSTPPESSPVYDQMLKRITGYAAAMPAEQANMAGLIELSVAMGWSKSRKSA
ncbi:MAG: cadherin-like domain-containing protein, partial [Vulcanococcus sp.]|uniref:cadherin-like domain-containing protein n=1 Tax=Vulcanococcus sp. TaxID=2856995 RepID=UPI0025E952E9